jgi:hypothetical protein
VRAPSIAIASYVRNREGVASSGEILERFGLSQSTLRRRRPELARLGIVFISDGNRSMYATHELTDNYLPSATKSERFNPHNLHTQRARARAPEVPAKCQSQPARMRAAGTLKFPDVKAVTASEYARTFDCRTPGCRGEAHGRGPDCQVRRGTTRPLPPGTGLDRAGRQAARRARGGITNGRERA